MLGSTNGEFDMMIFIQEPCTAGWCMGTHGSHAAVGLLLLLLCPMLCRYILVYPAGCDVCNHLSLFLCVADYDKLLPGNGRDPAVWAVGKWVAEAQQLDPEPCMVRNCQCLKQLQHQRTALVFLCCRLESLCTVHHCSR